MAHDHRHETGLDTGSHARPIAITLALVVLYMGVEVVGGVLSGSLALLADAGHMLSDAGALALTLFAMRMARRRPTAERTYGYYRAEILAALANGATLVAIAVYIFVEASERFRNPPEVQGLLMLAVACGGLLVNGAGLWFLRRGRESNLNVRGAWLHVLTDALGSIQAIVAGAMIWAFAWNWVDPVASVLDWPARDLLVLVFDCPIGRRAHGGSAWKREGGRVRAALLNLPNVSSVHDLHVWTITSGFVALSAHVTCTEPAKRDDVLQSAQRVLAERFGIRHSTIQIDRDPSCDGVTHARP